jgi:hypothetical protein
MLARELGERLWFAIAVKPIADLGLIARCHWLAKAAE